MPELGPDPTRWLGGVRDAISMVGYDVVLASADAELLTLSEHRHELEAALVGPSHQRLLEAMDKLSLTRLAKEAGFRVPETASLDAAHLPRFAYPAVIKPRLHGPAQLASQGVARRLETTVVRNAAEADRAAKRIRAAGAVPIIQSVVHGRLMAHSLASEGAGVLGTATQIAEVTWPRQAGVSARARTIPAPAEIETGTSHLLGRLHWQGLVQLQFLVDTRGVAHLIDLNPRLYGSLALAVRAGVNLPALAAEAQLRRREGGETPVQNPLRARPGVTYQWMEGDLRAALSREGGGLLEPLRHTPSSVSPIWDRRDPVPAVVSIGRGIARAARRLRSAGG